MARDYWVEGFSTGRPRFVKVSAAKPPPPLRRSNTHDGSQSERGRRVDFLDVTRKEYTSLQALNEDLRRENAALRANWQTADYDLRKSMQRVPALETTIRNLEDENARLRTLVDEARASNNNSSSHHHHHHPHHHHREREDGLRKLRHQNTRLRNDNDALLERIDRLEQGEGGGGSARRLADEVRKWKAQCARLDDQAESMFHKLDSVARRNKRLEMANESAARQARELQRDVDYYKAILRRHGFATR